MACSKPTVPGWAGSERSSRPPRPGTHEWGCRLMPDEMERMVVLHRYPFGADEHTSAAAVFDVAQRFLLFYLEWDRETLLAATRLWPNRGVYQSDYVPPLCMTFPNRCDRDYVLRLGHMLRSSSSYMVPMRPQRLLEVHYHLWEQRRIALDRGFEAFISNDSLCIEGFEFTYDMQRRRLMRVARGNPGTSVPRVVTS